MSSGVPTDLFDHGAIMRKQVVRRAAFDARERIVCPECGDPVDAPTAALHLPAGGIVEADQRGRVGDSIVTHGTTCQRHQYEVLIPSNCNGRDALGYTSGWRGLKYEFADGTVRWVAVPEREVERR